MGQDMDDAFGDIHDLLKENRFKIVANLLINEKTGKLNPPYDIDENHAYYILGNIAFKSCDFDKAIAFFKKSIAAWPADVQAYMALANSYSSKGLPEKAESALSSALKMDPENHTLLYNYANSLFDQKKFREAIAIYEKIPKESESAYELAHKNICTARYYLNKT